MHPAGASPPAARHSLVARVALAATATAVLAGVGTAIAATRTFTWPAEVLTGGVEIAVALAAALGAVAHRRRHDPTRRTALDGRSLVVWSAVVALVVAWELSALFGGVRHLHPTLSSLVDTAFRVDAAKAAGAALWLALGSWLALR
ncbi:MAG: hypothetical protein M0040_08250 [Actinomycetota bacterium]|nr:hypothetical protein [Actinomycetota bacterium]